VRYSKQNRLRPRQCRDGVVQNGTLKVGDNFVAGAVYGKVRSDVRRARSDRVKEAGPSTPVEVLGLKACRWRATPSSA
jgi:translation initiation factor IF-2